MTQATGPLADLLIVDLSRVLAGPYATMVLADLGARVIKVEQPGVGDDSRHIGPFSPSGQSAYFSSINRGKQSIALDLKADPDCAAFEALLARADVVVENYRPGVMSKLGYGWERLHAQFPRLIYAATSGFGHSGPDSRKAAYDMVVQAMGGIMSITGWPEGPPTRVGTSVGDITAGLFTAIGILSAVHDRTRTGLGQFVDVAMLDSQIAILENAIARFAVTGVSPGPLGARHPSITPFAAYACADGYVVIAAGNDLLWGKLSAALALADDPRFATNALRTEHVDAVAATIEAALAVLTTEAALALCDAAGIPSGPLHNTEQALNHRQVRARNMVIDTAFPDGSPLIAAGNPVKLSAHPDPAFRPKAPLLDEHRDTICQEFGL